MLPWMWSAHLAYEHQLDLLAAARRRRPHDRRHPNGEASTVRRLLLGRRPGHARVAVPAAAVCPAC